jgi:hypothetical protein
MDAETGRTTPEFLGGARKSKVGNNAEIDCCYSRWLRSRRVSTGTNTRASTAAGRNGYTSPLRLRPRQNARRGCLRGQDHHSADPQGSTEGLPQRRLLTRSWTERTGPQASPLTGAVIMFGFGSRQKLQMAQMALQEALMQLENTIRERDAYLQQRDIAIGERNAALAEIERLKRQAQPPV